MNDIRKRRGIGFYIISLLFILLYMIFGDDLAFYLKDAGYSPYKMYITFMLILLPFISLIWSLGFGYRIELENRGEYLYPIFGSPGWGLNIFIIPEKMSIRLLSGLITAILTVIGIRIGAIVKNKLAKIT